MPPPPNATHGADLASRVCMRCVPGAACVCPSSVRGAHHQHSALGGGLAHDDGSVPPASNAAHGLQLQRLQSRTSDIQVDIFLRFVADFTLLTREATFFCAALCPAPDNAPTPLSAGSQLTCRQAMAISIVAQTKRLWRTSTAGGDLAATTTRQYTCTGAATVSIDVPQRNAQHHQGIQCVFSRNFRVCLKAVVLGKGTRVRIQQAGVVLVRQRHDPSMLRISHGGCNVCVATAADFSCTNLQLVTSSVALVRCTRVGRTLTVTP